MDTSSAEGGIHAVAARIHERAVQLANEQEALKQTQQELQELQASHATEKNRARQVRKDYLQSVLQLNTVELECCNVQDQIAERETKTKKLQQETNDMVEQLEQQQTEWETTVQDKLVQHKVRQELYQKHLQGAIEARQKAMARRHNMLAAVQRLTQQAKHDRQNTLQEQQRVQADMMRMTETEDETNQQVEVLASQVRAALGKVRSVVFLLLFGMRPFFST